MMEKSKHMDSFFVTHSYLKVLAVMMVAIVFGYYMYYGSRAFSTERADFREVPYDSAQGSAELRNMLEVAEMVDWHLDGEGKQNAFYRPSTNGTVLIFLHGSPGNGAGFHRMVSEFAELGFGALVIDLPGYGASEGKRNWGAKYIDSVQSGMDFLQNLKPVDAVTVVLLGYSQGANTAIRTAVVDQRVSALILLAGYTNLKDHLIQAFHRQLPGIGWFAIAAAKLSGLDMAKMDNIASLKNLDARPVLVISGMNDFGIPPEMAATLAEAPTNSQLWLVNGAGHIDIPEKAGLEFYRKIAKFVRVSFGEEMH